MARLWGRHSAWKAFRNGEGFRLGTHPQRDFSPGILIRRVIALSDETEEVADGALQVPGRQAASSRVTLTVVPMLGDITNNAYANDPRTRLANWGRMANEA